ncbi:hypothetical protein F5887DRAFT_35858 [Amanita rubescens]|nr:hypothetical protein F5887DRAFT_35858 [Amanita rubescens]
MAHLGTSHLHGADQTTLGQPQGHPTYTFFPNARDFSIVGAIFNDVHHDHHAEGTAFDGLKSHISEAAMYDSLARYPPPKCHPKTRKKVLKIISDWIDDSYPRQRIMWLNGPAGAGKSAIAQTVAERYKDSRLAASFFFP